MRINIDECQNYSESFIKNDIDETDKQHTQIVSNKNIINQTDSKNDLHDCREVQVVSEQIHNEEELDKRKFQGEDEPGIEDTTMNKNNYQDDIKNIKEDKMRDTQSKDLKMNQISPNPKTDQAEPVEDFARTYETTEKDIKNDDSKERKISKIESEAHYNEDIPKGQNEVDNHDQNLKIESKIDEEHKGSIVIPASDKSKESTKTQKESSKVNG